MSIPPLPRSSGVLLHPTSLPGPFGIGDLGPVALQEQVENLVRKGNETKGLAGLFSIFRANVPQLKVEPDERQCMIRGVALRDFSDTLRIYEGSLYVNDVNLFDRTWQVIVQADDRFRDEVEDLK